jgi:hypothetical protein
MTDTERLAQAKAEILKDIEENILPEDLADLADMGDHVFIDYYGGILDADEELAADLDTVTRLRDALDLWLRAGRPDPIDPAQGSLL